MKYINNTEKYKQQLIKKQQYHVNLFSYMSIIGRTLYWLVLRKGFLYTSLVSGDVVQY